jgi:Skp family chaperone for outer membrane proteins
MAAVKKIGESGSYVYVVDLSVGSIPFVNSALSTDITDQIKKEVGAGAAPAAAPATAPAQ